MNHRLVAVFLGSSLLAAASAFAGDPPRSTPLSHSSISTGSTATGVRRTASTSESSPRAREDHPLTAPSPVAGAPTARPKGLGTVRAAVAPFSKDAWKQHAPARGELGPLVDAPARTAPARAYFPLKEPKGKVPAQVAHMTSVFERAYAAHVAAPTEEERDVTAMRLGMAYAKLYNDTEYAAHDYVTMGLKSRRGELVERVRVAMNARAISMNLLSDSRYAKSEKTIGELQQATDELIEHATTLGTIVGSADAEKQVLGEPWKQSLKQKVAVLRSGVESAVAIVKAPYVLARYGGWF